MEHHECREWVAKVHDELKSLGEERNRISGRRFFKEDVELHGIRAALVSGLGRKYYQEIKDLDKDAILSCCEGLWQTGYMEAGFIACHLSHAIRKRYQQADFDIFEHWIHHYITNWATCDTLCNHSLGAFIEMYPSFIHHLKTFTHSGNRWVKRAAAVSLIVPARKGMFLEDILEIAQRLLTDPDDMVQKGYGWLLKVASQQHQQLIFDFVMLNKQKMPRTALRYAIEKMPPELRQQAMQK